MDIIGLACHSTVIHFILETLRLSPLFPETSDRHWAHALLSFRSHSIMACLHLYCWYLSRNIRTNIWCLPFYCFYFSMFHLPNDDYLLFIRIGEHAKAVSSTSWPANCFVQVKETRSYYRPPLLKNLQSAITPFLFGENPVSSFGRVARSWTWYSILVGSWSLPFVITISFFSSTDYAYQYLGWANTTYLCPSA